MLRRKKSTSQGVTIESRGTVSKAVGNSMLLRSNQLLSRRLIVYSNFYMAMSEGIFRGGSSTSASICEALGIERAGARAMASTCAPFMKRLGGKRQARRKRAAHGGAIFASGGVTSARVALLLFM